MEVLPPELQLIIAKKIAASSTRGLLPFRASAKLHQRLSKNPVVLRAVSEDCLRFLSSLRLTRDKRHSCNNLLSLAMHYITLSERLQCFINFTLNLPMIQSVLRNTQNAGSDEATYFLIMLKALTSEGFDRDRVLSLFHDLFTRQRLAHCRSVISIDGLLFDLGQHELRSMPPGLDYKFICLSDGACAMSNRIRNSHLRSPGEDKDYDMINICCHTPIFDLRTHIHTAQFFSYPEYSLAFRKKIRQKGILKYLIFVSIPTPLLTFLFS